MCVSTAGCGGIDFNFDTNGCFFHFAGTQCGAFNRLNSVTHCKRDTANCGEATSARALWWRALGRGVGTWGLGTSGPHAGSRCI